MTINFHSEGLDSVLSVADAACDAAKNKGQNRSHIYQADDGELEQQRSEV